MERAERTKRIEEWKEILREHPTFARSILAQQAILIEASGHYELIANRMCELLKTGLPVLYEDYWISLCEVVSEDVLYRTSSIIACLRDSNRDPARCFGSDDPEGWFDDPFAGGQVLPPLPPDPHASTSSSPRAIDTVPLPEKPLPGSSGSPRAIDTVPLPDKPRWWTRVMRRRRRRKPGRRGPGR